MHDALRAAVDAALSAKELSRTPPGKKVSNFALLSGVAAHDLYHAGQIQLLKRLSSGHFSGKLGAFHRQLKRLKGTSHEKTCFCGYLCSMAARHQLRSKRRATRRAGQRQRRAGGGATQAVPSVSKRPNGGGLATIRMGAPDNTMWFGWRVAAPMASLKGMTFSDALAKADVWPVASVEASSTQITSFEVPKPLDQRLQANERAAVVYRLREIAESIAAYRVDNIGADAAMRRRVFEFAKSINAPLIITSADAANLAELDKLAEEFEINVALESKGDPKTVMAALEGRGKRMGVSAHLGGWAQAGVKAVDGLAIVKDKLLHVTAADRSALNARARVVALGEGAGGRRRLFSRRRTRQASSRCRLRSSRSARPKPTW